MQSFQTEETLVLLVDHSPNHKHHTTGLKLIGLSISIPDILIVINGKWLEDMEEPVVEHGPT